MRCFGIHVASFNNMFHLTKPILTCVKLNVCVWYAVHPESPTGFDRCCTRESIFHIKNLDSNIYPITQSLMWKKTEVVFYFQSCYLPTWIANGIPNKTWTDFAFVVGVFFFWIVFRNHLLYKHPWLWTTTLLFQQVFIGEEIAESERNLVDAACASHRERHLESCLHHTFWEWETPSESCLHCTLKARETLRAAYTHQTPWEWETPWELLTSHTPCESERNPESCLYTSNTLRVRETLRAAYITPCESERHFESCLHHTLRVRDTLRAAYITTCESVRKTLRQLPSETLCESFTWRDFLWALV